MSEPRYCHYVFEFKGGYHPGLCGVIETSHAGLNHPFVPDPHEAEIAKMMYGLMKIVGCGEDEGRWPPGTHIVDAAVAEVAELRKVNDELVSYFTAREDAKCANCGYPRRRHQWMGTIGAPIDPCPTSRATGSRTWKGELEAEVERLRAELARRDKIASYRYDRCNELIGEGVTASFCHYEKGSCPNHRKATR